jgi:A/G-specific adenine glycosylase
MVLNYKIDTKHNWNTKQIKRFQEKLLLWYQKHKRSLPWRDNPTPYRVWISEIMLQQTQVNTVLPYYDRFLQRFPDIQTLAHASETEVLELWAGLGYYSRARNLHRAARQILNEYGNFPENFGNVLSLPGIGRYTAGAICSIALNQAHPIVDGNIRRVLIRLHGIRGIRDSVPEKFFWDQMSAWLPEGPVSSFNQAMMEIGALICTPHRPQCAACPIRSLCQARKSGIQNNIPTITAKRSAESVQISMLLLGSNKQILITSSHKPHFIPGKWGFPCQIMSNGESAKESAKRLCREILGRTIRIEPCGQYRHSISHRRILVYAFYGKSKIRISRLKQKENYRWAAETQGNQMLISALFFKAIRKYKALQGL